MKVLVIGGSRFLGHHITRRLLEKGHEVTLFNRGITPDDFGNRVERIQGDRYDARSFSEKLRTHRFDVVVDMIAYKPEDSRMAVETFLGHLDHYIHISTAAVYTVTQDYPCPLREEDYDRPLYRPEGARDEGWVYGVNKRGCEDVLREAHKVKGFPATMFRLPIVIGERDPTLRAYSYFIRIADQKPIILPDSGMNVFTHVYQGDVARTLVDNLQNPLAVGEVYNLAQERAVTLRSFVQKAARIIGVEPELVDIPAEILRRASLGTPFSPFFNRRPFVLDVRKAKKDLQFFSTPLETWLQKTIRWFFEQYEGGPPENYALRDRELDLIARYKRAAEALG